MPTDTIVVKTTHVHTHQNLISYFWQQTNQFLFCEKCESPTTVLSNHTLWNTAHASLLHIHTPVDRHAHNKHSCGSQEHLVTAVVIKNSTHHQKTAKQSTQHSITMH